MKPVGDLLPDAEDLHSKKLMPEDAELSERDQLVLELVEVGIGLRKAENLVDNYPRKKILKQLKWLPYRNARRPASLFIASIERDYDAPVYASKK